MRSDLYVNSPIFLLPCKNALLKTILSACIWPCYCLIRNYDSFCFTKSGYIVFLLYKERKMQCADIPKTLYWPKPLMPKPVVCSEAEACMAEHTNITHALFENLMRAVCTETLYGLVLFCIEGKKWTSLCYDKAKWSCSKIRMPPTWQMNYFKSMLLRNLL